MPTCKVVLYGLKPSEITYSTNENASDISSQRQRSFSTTTSNHQAESRVSPETDYLNLHIKPLATPRTSVRKRANRLIYFSLEKRMQLMISSFLAVDIQW